MTQEDIKTLVEQVNDTVIEDISDCESECCEGHHHHNEDADEEQYNKAGKPISRNEKKARKLIAKLGLKPVPGIQRLTIKRTANVIFAISQPDVYRIPNSDTYIVFGEAKFEDLVSQWQRSAVQNAAASSGYDAKDSHLAGAGSLSDFSMGNSMVESSAVEDSEPQDETGLDPKDIETVMKQASVSRNKAVKALKESENDIVNAIMALSM
jgi:nascent polypeptide-associated complex subunit alpha